MSKRWKPGLNEVFWYISSNNKIDYTTNNGFGCDEEKIAAGNCFFTKAEAQTAAEKVKALLLSLHDSVTDCNQLPKLTAEVFNSPDCPEWARYAAVDGSGYAYYYSERPFILSDSFGWGIVCGENTQSELIPGRFTHINWSESRIERPVVLPGWCKIGEWVE